MGIKKYKMRCIYSANKMIHTQFSHVYPTECKTHLEADATQVYPGVNPSNAS